MKRFIYPMVLPSIKGMLFRVPFVADSGSGDGSGHDLGLKRGAKRFEMAAGHGLQGKCGREKMRCRIRSGMTERSGPA